MKALYAWTGALVLYGLALAVMAPATLLDEWLDSRTAARLRLTAVRGTLWSGQGRLEVRGAQGAAALTKPVRWQLDAAQLMFARFVWLLEFPAEQQQVAVSASWSGIEIAGLDLQLPAAAVVHAWPLLAGYGLGGTMQLQVDRLHFGRGVSEASATLQWHEASTALAPVSPLGSYELGLHGNGGDIGISLHTLQGPLQLAGEGSLDGSLRAQFDAVARVAPAERELLAPFMRLFAVENADGSFALQFN